MAPISGVTSRGSTPRRWPPPPSGRCIARRRQTGRRWSIKIQYPGVRAAIDSDLDNAAALIRWSGMMPEELDLGPLMAEARKQLHEEADYAREGAYMARFAALLEDDPRFVVPRYLPELSAPGALAMSYEPVRADRDAGGCPPEVRDRAMTALIDLCLRELFEFRMMQTDPNFANYRWRPETGQIVLAGFRRDAGDR
jgi:predicted unusual protein kinase regulating ubiquinone biosynthesis (AarF/ABC1/UbiB family)